MNIVAQIAKKIRGNPCERLVKQYGTEVKVEGAEFGAGVFRFNIGEFSTQVKEFWKVPKVMIALDTSQYLLCGAINEIKNNSSFKEDCRRIRLMLIVAFSHLQSILAVQKPSLLNKEIVKWVRYMNKLHKESLEYLKPGPRMISKSVAKSSLSNILKYQGIEEEQMKEALSILQ